MPRVDLPVIAAFCMAVACVSRARANPQPPVVDVEIDPRLELLGVVQRLADRATLGPEDASYASQVEARFAPWRGHPAVRLYSEIAADDHDPLGVVLLYYSAPPALALLDPQARVPFLDTETEELRFARFLRELRDFARATNFEGFFHDHAPLYRVARQKALAAIDAAQGPPERAIGAYAGLALDLRRHYELSLLYNPRKRNSFIVPYPDPATLTEDPGKFDVYTLSLFLDGKPRADNREVSLFEAGSRELWQETIFLVVEPELYWFEHLARIDRVSFYGSEIAACRGVHGVDCVKAALVEALLWRIRGRVNQQRPENEALVAALAQKLSEYEARRDLYPTLWKFWPELMSVFSLQHGGSPVRSEALGRRFSPTRVGDFFSPTLRARLKS